MSVRILQIRLRHPETEQMSNWERKGVLSLKQKQKSNHIIIGCSWIHCSIFWREGGCPKSRALLRVNVSFKGWGSGGRTSRGLCLG